MKYYIAFIIIIFCSCTHKDRITYCIDGDTVVTSSGERLRLANVDCPEATRGHIQTFGPEAWAFTNEYLQGKTVSIKITGHDKYGRSIADIYLQDGRYFNEMLVIAGMAYVYPQYAPRYIYEEELTAKIKRIGLWAYPNESPYKFRHHGK